MSQFEKLMQELGAAQAAQETMTKALPADDGKDDKNIQAAAAEGGSDGGAGNGATGDEELGEDGKPMAKSFQLTLEDGTVVEAQDGSEMVKALNDQMTAFKTDTGKVMESIFGLVKGQSEMTKSLSETVKKLGGEGRGRKATLSVVEKPSAGESQLAKAQANGVSHDEFFAKALDMQKAGKISGQEIAFAETCLNRGEPIPDSIKRRVLA